MITIGDALIEVQDWKEAAHVYEHILKSSGDYTNHPIGLHSIAQGAYCQLMAGNLDRCQSLLNRFPRKDAESLSAMVITAAAELARYIAVEELYSRKCGQPPSKSAQKSADELLKGVSIIVKKSPSNRVEYLRTLFFAVLARDLELIFDT
jgi:hypothetical protein